MTDKFQKYYLDNVLFYNKQNIEKINNIINKQECYLGNVLVPLNMETEDYLKNIIGRIEKYNEIVQIIEYTSTTKLEDYRRAIFRYKSTLLFGQLEQSYYVYEEIVYLSQGLLEPLDIIGNNRKLGLIMASLTNIRGGSRSLKLYNNNIGLYDKILPNISYSEYKNIINENKDKSISVAIRLCLYYNLLKVEKDELKLFNALQNLYNLTYIFYDYTSKTVINDDFVSILIGLYMENKLQKMSVEEYEERLKEWYNTVRDPETDPFKGFIEDENKSIEDTTTKKKGIKTKRININKIYKNIQRNNKTKKIKAK